FGFTAPLSQSRQIGAEPPAAESAARPDGVIYNSLHDSGSSERAAAGPLRSGAGQTPAPSCTHIGSLARVGPRAPGEPASHRHLLYAPRSLAAAARRLHATARCTAGRGLGGPARDAQRAGAGPAALA